MSTTKRLTLLGEVQACRACAHGSTRKWLRKHALNAVLAVSDHPIVAQREALGLSQSALAEALGVSRQTIHAWETQPVRQDRLDRVLALRKTLRASA